jgi:hypothetical protein
MLVSTTIPESLLVVMETPELHEERKMMRNIEKIRGGFIGSSDHRIIGCGLSMRNKEARIKNSEFGVVS